MRLNIGCGPVWLRGYLNVDISPLDVIAESARCAGKPDTPPAGTAFLQFDLAERWPWLDNSVEAIIANELLEHLDSPTLTHVLTEAWRVLVPGLSMTGGVPDYERVFQYYQEGSDWLWSPAWVTAGPYDTPAENALQNFAHGWGHRQVFTERMLRKRLETAGFQVVVTKGEFEGLLFQATKVQEVS